MEESKHYVTQDVNVRNILSTTEQQFAFQESNNPNCLAVQQAASYATHPYNCSQCGRIYMWKSTLHRHMKFECGKEPNIPCPYCPYRTKRTDELKKHMRKIHHLKTKWGKLHGMCISFGDHSHLSVKIFQLQNHSADFNDVWY
jgi:DNA-directed RNA polymerase subunit RPC12/RpoP